MTELNKKEHPRDHPPLHLDAHAAVLAVDPPADIEAAHLATAVGVDKVDRDPHPGIGVEIDTNANPAHAPPHTKCAMEIRKALPMARSPVAMINGV